jgi:hypothetical protein
MANNNQPSQESINQAIKEYYDRVPQVPEVLGVL